MINSHAALNEMAVFVFGEPCGFPESCWHSVSLRSSQWASTGVLMSLHRTLWAATPRVCGAGKMWKAL